MAQKLLIALALVVYAQASATTSAPDDVTTSAPGDEDVIDYNPDSCHYYQDVCGLLCEGSSDCIEGGKGSYCKHWNYPAVCQGFYWNSAVPDDGYFYWNGTGNQTWPLTCEDANYLVYEDCSRHLTCEDLCLLTPDCVESQQASSYCKTNGDCFGLYWESFENRTQCYFNGSNDCPETTPVKCDAYGVIEDNPIGDCPYSTTPKPVTTGKPESTGSPSKTTVSPTEIIYNANETCNYFQDVCGLLCADDEDCADGGEGSYCKWWLDEPSCQGFYWHENDTSSVYFYSNDTNTSLEWALSCQDANAIYYESCQLHVSCDDLCLDDADCYNSDQGSSYCKSNNACSGLYWVDQSNGDYCYFDGTNDCDESDPIQCDYNDGLVEGYTLEVDCPYVEEGGTTAEPEGETTPEPEEETTTYP